MFALRIAFWIVGGLVALAGLYWSLFHDRSRGRRRCPKCWYDLRATTGLQCPECGYTAPRESKLHNSRRRWKLAIVIMIVAITVPAYRWRRPLYRASIPFLPSTALMLNIEWGKTENSAAFAGMELLRRVMDQHRAIVDRPERNRLWRWQWNMIDHMPSGTKDRWWVRDLAACATVYSSPPPPSLIRLAPHDIESAFLKPSAESLNSLYDRLQIPKIAFESSDPSTLKIHRVLDLTTDVPPPVRLFLIGESRLSVFGEQKHFQILATRQEGPDWVFVGWVDICSSNAVPTLAPAVSVDGNPTFEIGAISNYPRFGCPSEESAWCMVGQSDIDVLCAIPNQVESKNTGSPFNYQYSTRILRTNLDARDRFIDVEYTVHFINDGNVLTWNRVPTPDEVAVRGLQEVFTPTGTIRFRWNTGLNQFVPSESESDWTAQPNSGWLDVYDEKCFNRNFDTIASLAVGDDLAKAAWVRLALTRLKDSPEKRRLIREINRRAGRILIDDR